MNRNGRSCYRLWNDAVDNEPRRPGPADRTQSEWAGVSARVWSGHSEYPVVFDWVDGQIEVESPDEPTITRMRKLAARHSANVVSETGEIFTHSGQSDGFLPGYP